MRFPADLSSLSISTCGGSIIHWETRGRGLKRKTISCGGASAKDRARSICSWNVDISVNDMDSAVREYGAHWEEVCLHVGRHASDCRDRYRNHIIHKDMRVDGADA